MNVGEIWLVELTDTLGREVEKKRPAVVIATHDATGLIVVVPFSSSAGLDRFGFVTPVKKSPQNGLAMDSTAVVFQIRSLDEGRFKHKLGTLESHYMADVKTLIHGFLRLESVVH